MERRWSTGEPVGRGGRTATVLSAGISLESTDPPRSDIAMVRNGVHDSSLDGCG